MIQISSVSKRMGQVLAVNNVSFQVPDGVILGLLGPNGAGKTTTLRMMAGVLTPDRGSIRVGAHHFAVNSSEIRKTTGAMLDHTGLYDRLTAREHLTFFGRLRHLPPTTLSGRIDELAADLTLTRILDRRVAGLSQGERMKLALACALIHAPQHLLLDEPTNGLDPGSIVEFRRILRRLRDRGTAIVFSSHVLSEVAEVCDRLVVLREGSVAQEGSLHDICAAAGTSTLEFAFMKLTQTES